MGGHGLNQRQFNSLLVDLDVAYGGVCYFTEVRWLSCEKVLKRFYELREAITFFTESKQNPVPQIEDATWLRDLTFLADITGHLNVLNLSMQGRDKLVTDLFDQIQSFRTKLNLWITQLKDRNLTHFPTLKEECTRSKLDEDPDLSLYINALSDLSSAFTEWFKDFGLLDQTFQLFVAPFSVQPHLAPAEFQIELVDLQCDRVLKERYRLSETSSGGIVTFYTELPKDRFPRLHLLAARTLCMFGTTYCCEQFFSHMKHVKSPTRSSINDTNLSSTLRVAVTNSLTPNIDKLVASKRCQVSRPRSRDSTGSNTSASSL